MDATTTDIYAALRKYRCQYMRDDEGNGIEIVDVMTPQWDPTILTGEKELELLAEHIADELFHRNRG